MGRRLSLSLSLKKRNSLTITKIKDNKNDSIIIAKLTIIINKDVCPSNVKDVIKHEMVHIDQMKRGDLNYDDDNVYWKGKTYPRNAVAIIRKKIIIPIIHSNSRGCLYEP